MRGNFRNSITSPSNFHATEIIEDCGFGFPRTFATFERLKLELKTGDVVELRFFLGRAAAFC
jgi:hypothetical protein